MPLGVSTTCASTASARAVARRNAAPRLRGGTVPAGPSGAALRGADSPPPTLDSSPTRDLPAQAQAYVGNGLGAGYAVASPEIAEWLTRSGYSVNSAAPTVEAGCLPALMARRVLCYFAS